VTPPIAPLLVAARFLVPFEDRRDILDLLDRQAFAITVEMRPDCQPAHYDSSAPHSVHAVAVTNPLVAALMAAMFWPGVTVTYSTALAGRKISAVVAVC